MNNPFDQFGFQTLDWFNSTTGNKWRTSMNFSGKISGSEAAKCFEKTTDWPPAVMYEYLGEEGYSSHFCHQR